VGDFAGGLASRRVATILTILGSQSIGLLAACVAILLSGERFPGPETLAWGAAAGVAGATGLYAFYRALAGGQMAIVAPLTAVIGAGIPAAVGIVRGDQLVAVQLVGMACGLAAIVVVSWPGRAAPGGGSGGLPPLPLILVGGLGFAGFFLAIHQAMSVGGTTWWPLFGARVATVALALAVAVVMRPRRAGLRGVTGLIVLAGLTDYGGNALFLLASRGGTLSAPVILSSLYPVATALLAAWLLHERLRRWQLAGVGLALVGVALIAV
jgi:drug/metabolite transporter (DMT)-like permease